MTETSTLSVKQAAPWVLIALSPVIFALATSNPFDPENLTQYLLRRYGLPIAGIEIAVIGLAAWSGLRPISGLRRAPSWTWGVLGGLIVLALGSALTATNPGIALLHFHMWLVHLLFGLSVAALASAAPEIIRRFFWPAIVVGLLLFVLALAAYVALIPDPGEFNWLGFGFAVTNIRHTGFFAATGIAASLGIALTSRAIPRALAGSAAAIFFALAFWGGSRGPLVAMAAALTFAFVWFKSLRTTGNVILTLSSFVGGALLSRLHHVPDKHFGLERLKSALQGNSLEHLTSERLTVWRETWAAIIDQPLFGYGQGQFRSTVHAVQHLEISHPHNSLLQAMFDWGVLGASCFFALLLYLSWLGLRRTTADPLHLPAFLVAAALLLMSLHDGVMFFTYPIAMLAVAFAWAICTGQGAVDRSPHSAIGRAAIPA